MVDVLGIKPEESSWKGNCLLKRRSVWHDHGHEGRESQVQGHRLHQMSTSILCTEFTLVNILGTVSGLKR